MKKFDIYLQYQRIKKVAPFLKNGMNILDIGGGNGELFEYYLNKNIQLTGIVVDPDIKNEKVFKNYKLVSDFFPSSKINIKNFDLITMLAVLEHIPPEQLDSFIINLKTHLKDEGLVIITVPSNLVDNILNVLKLFKIIDGMELHQHHGYNASKTQEIFERQGLKLIKHKRFQLGLNNLFVFKK